jgi:hypothetical protein
MDAHPGVQREAGLEGAATGAARRSSVVRQRQTGLHRGGLQRAAAGESGCAGSPSRPPRDALGGTPIAGRAHVEKDFDRERQDDRLVELLGAMAGSARG